MAVPKQIKDRYEIRQVLGQGGMGVVYNAYDTVVKRSVALKTVRDTPSRAALELFYKECDVLASISHPNIVEIFDLGEFDDDGASKPYFVMPLLPGKTLGELIAAKSSRLTVSRVVEIICQTCRGLQAAHERGLVHRDLKPSNLLVMEDDSVKIIDFGIAHMADAHSTVGHKGTLLYMAPEQVELKAPSALSDIFALGVVSFEAITLRHPFERGTASELASAIVKHIPPPASELNPLVNGMISRVIHKAMAKQPWYRFASARELAEALQKAARNEPLEMFDPARIQPRIERVRKTFQQGDYQFADEILTELEVEGYVDEAIASLRRCINDSQRQRMIAQLLDSARTRAEQQEYPLALQKLQELLSMDPAHGAALALQRSIENRRSEQKIEDWLCLAHQHKEQSAFSHARQAIQNVLELKPGDVRALKLMAEVDRREQEFVRSRQEQDKLYAKAMEAWQNGEVSAALSKLERLVTLGGPNDTAAPERASTFQNFYNQVRSEHDAIKSAYESARKNLADGSFDAALEICKQQLTVHPGQALFQALKFDVEERQRQELSHCIAEVDRLVETEPDLEKRVTILADALQRYPGESHFERALRTMREKRHLVKAIQSRAQSYEDHGQYADALGQWEILKTIYSQYPGLDFEMERVRRRRDQQVLSDAKAKWVERIDWLLGAGDYAHASELLKSAAVEFPEDAELMELEKLAAQGVTRAAEAQNLLVEGQDLCAQRRLAEAIEVLWRAHRLDEKNAILRAALTAALVEHARGTLDSDWQAAGELARQALQLDPASAAAKSVWTLAQDRKRDEFVDRCAAQVRRMQTEGQLQPALQQVQAALSQFPHETRLQQLRSTLMRAYSEAQEAASRPEDPLRSPTPVAEETMTVAAPGTSPPRPAPSPAAGSDESTFILSQTENVPAPPAPSPPKPPRVRPPVPPAPPVSNVPPPAAVPSPVTPSRRNTMIALLGASIVLMVLIVGVLVMKAVMKRPRPSQPAQPSSPIAAAPAPAAAPPPNAAVRVFADIEGVRITLDDQPAVELEEGQFAVTDLPSGAHTLKIGGLREQAAISFKTATGAVPVVDFVSAKEAVAITVASLGGHANVQSSLGSVKVSLDGAPAGESTVTGLELNGLSPGNHDLAFGEGKDRRVVTVSLGEAPALTAFLKSDRNVGTLIVDTGEDGVRVWVNGKEQRRQTQKGKLRITGLDVKGYTIRVAKDGFLDTPEQQVDVRKGEEAKLEFALRPVPKVASLAIAGGIPGTDVVLDQNSIGTVRDDGSFSAMSVPPGDHVIELRKESYRAKRFERHFEAGGAVTLASTDAALEKLQGTIALKVTPADARVTISRAGEAPRPATGTSLTVGEGSYTVSARAPNFIEHSIAVTVAAGETRNAEIVLEHVSTAEPQKRGMFDWDDPAGWSLANNWYARKGGNFVGYKPAQTTGTFVFTVELRKGKKLQWVAARTDDFNYVLFQMDKKFFYRAQVVNAKETQLKKVPHTLEKLPAYTIQIEVANGSIVHKYWDGSKWLLLDDWQEPGRPFQNGKFGFLIPGTDTIGLSNFSFAPK